MMPPAEQPLRHRRCPPGDNPLSTLREALESGSELGVRKALMGLTNVNSPDVMTGDRALHLLVEHDFPDGITNLLRRRADPNLANRLHRTPLHLAARLGRDRCLSILLEAKADPDTVSSDGSRPIFDAVFYARRSTVDLLFRHAPEVSNSRNANLETPLHTLASTSGDPVIANQLLSSGTAIDATDIDNNTALHLAVEHAHEPLTRCLLAAGAHASHVNKLGLTPDLVPTGIESRDNTRCASLVTHYRWVRHLQRFATNPSHLVLMGG